MNLHGILSFWGKADIAIFLIRDGQTVFWIENEYGRGMIYGNEAPALETPCRPVRKNQN